MQITMLLNSNSQLLAVLPLLMSVVSVRGFSSGAISDACVDMTPGHGGSTQETASPYEIQLSTTTYTAGSTIDVTISGNANTMFRGFLLMARSTGGTEPVGSFTTLPANAQKVCGNRGGAAHTDNNDKESIQLTWTAPNAAVGDIQFRATVVQTQPTWWENIMSEAIMEESGESSEDVSTEASSEDNVTEDPSAESTHDDSGLPATQDPQEETTSGGMTSYSFYIALLATLGTLVIITTGRL